MSKDYLFGLNAEKLHQKSHTGIFPFNEAKGFGLCHIQQTFIDLLMDSQMELVREKERERERKRERERMCKMWVRKEGNEGGTLGQNYKKCKFLKHITIL